MEVKGLNFSSAAFSLIDKVNAFDSSTTLADKNMIQS